MSCKKLPDICKDDVIFLRVPSDPDKNRRIDQEPCAGTDIRKADVDATGGVWQHPPGIYSGNIRTRSFCPLPLLPPLAGEH
ncbi:hypothetical protein EVAR_20164_1 [Eumeta japonica]|uniref:Uncharacterized protein n=1 Tax=Eumeta variegata TaxID=151549 RepID=A0A4C1UTS3_EUMVA|nr:hypothetical protein EVAR_20164_1 [Eumeta japonica]